MQCIFLKVVFTGQIIVEHSQFGKTTPLCSNLYRRPVLGHQGLCKDNHARLSKASHKHRPPLVRQKGGCSRLRDSYSEDSHFCEKPVLEVSGAGVKSLFYQERSKM